MSVWWWWVLALVLGIVELLTGTFYLLVWAVAAVAAGIAAWAFASLALQVVVAALVGLSGTWALRRWRRGSAAPPVESNPDVNLDIGAIVDVTAWDDGVRTRVRYRGSHWDARLVPGATAVAGRHVIRAVEANRLVLAPLDAQAATAPGIASRS